MGRGVADAHATPERLPVGLEHDDEWMARVVEHLWEWFCFECPDEVPGEADLRSVRRARRLSAFHLRFQWQEGRRGTWTSS